MEIIAKKKKSLIVQYSVLAVLGLAILALGIYFLFSFWELSVDLQFGTILLIAGGPLVTAVYVFFCFRVRFTAGTITYDGKKIDFGKGHVVSPSQIITVDYRKAYFTQKSNAWGSLTVTTGDFVLEYHYIERVEEVCNRLLELRDNDK